jgi:hypothetical protein
MNNNADTVSQSSRPPSLKKIKHVNNYFLTVPSQSDGLDAAVLSRTPGNIRRSSSAISGDLFSNKFTQHRRSVESLNATNKTPYIAEVSHEIRSQLETAKEEISTLQFEFEKKF